MVANWWIVAFLRSVCTFPHEVTAYVTQCLTHLCKCRYEMRVCFVFCMWRLMIEFAFFAAGSRAVLVWKVFLYVIEMWYLSLWFCFTQLDNGLSGLLYCHLSFRSSTGTIIAVIWVHSISFEAKFMCISFAELFHKVFISIIPFGGDKVSMLTHTYPHKPLRKIKMTICNHQVDSPLHVWSDLVICKFGKNMVIHDTECPYWDQVSNNTNQTISIISNYS